MNEQVTKVIDAYLDAEKLAVPHAILIEGAWGSGKTYFLEKIYEPKRKAKREEQRLHHTPFLFVSLFGATSAADVEMRIYKAACPGEAAIGGLAGTFALGIGEFFGIKETTSLALKKVAKKIIQQLNDAVFVFDDLERVETEAIREVMGLVNAFVAQHERRVILVADEKKLLDLHKDSEWKSQNEKIIGRRARIEPDIETVVKIAVSNLKNSLVKDFMSERASCLIEVARKSSVENLRCLSWALYNASVFVECLLIDADIPDDHIESTMSIVQAITLSYRMDLLSFESLSLLPGLPEKILVRSVNKRKSDKAETEEDQKHFDDATKFLETFDALNVDKPPIDYCFIHEFEVSGVLDREEIVQWIKSRFGFGLEYKEPAWRTLWYRHQRTFGEFDHAISDLKDELVRREHTIPGIILHAAGLAISFRQANNQALTDGTEVYIFFKYYIDDLVEKKLLKNPVNQDLLRMSSYDGLGFTASETEEFRSIYAYMIERFEYVVNCDLKEQAEEIIRKAEDGYYGALNQFFDKSLPELSNKPVLLDFDVDRIASLFTKDNFSLEEGRKLLAYRYQYAHQGGPLIDEIAWARSVYAAMLDKLKKWPEPHGSLRMNDLNVLLQHYERSRPPEAKILVS